MPRNPQLALFKKGSAAYGGDLLKTRKGRSTPRPLAVRSSMHLVLRSSKARGEWSFLRHQTKIRQVFEHSAKKWGVRLISLANVGNHLHLHIQLTSRHTYAPFIRGTTGALAMLITGASRWKRRLGGTRGSKARFFDYRPFTRVIVGFRALLSLKDYLQINQLEGFGVGRRRAEFAVRGPDLQKWLSSG